MSVCLHVVRAPSTIATMLREMIMGEKNSEAFGSIGLENLIKPYPPNFSSIPASKIDPEIGASTCAWGNHM